MDILTIIAFLVVSSALFSYLNVRFLKLPGTIGVMAVSIAVSLLVLIAGKSGTGISGTILTITRSINFSKVLLDVLLGFLLFASALHIDVKRLKTQRRAVFGLSTIGVVISTAAFGFLFYGAAKLTGIQVPLIYCFIFGALISPTDPIAVAAILKKSKIPARLETIISGESMFNDAVGLILFVTLLDITDTSTPEFTWAHTGLLFSQEVLGGVVIGLAFGYIGYRLMRSINDFQTILLLSVSLVFGISVLAQKLHGSVPLAVVAAGLVVGNHDFGKERAAAHQYLVQVWKLIDEVLNTILFVMIGLQLVVLPMLSNYWVIGLLSIAACLLARLISIMLPAMLLVREVTAGNLSILTWAGLRGGISIAMALSLPSSPYREVILAACYFIVLFSVLVQGLSLNKVVAVAVKR
jgi:CPA1 family monovalent cation:H+ antiporter